jgi:hypothetical protein
VAFEIVVDDYAEVWVNGKAAFVLGQNGGSVAAGWNAPNRVVLTRRAAPGTFKSLCSESTHSRRIPTHIWVQRDRILQGWQDQQCPRGEGGSGKKDALDSSSGERKVGSSPTVCLH